MSKEKKAAKGAKNLWMRNGTWYLVATVNGTRYSRSMGTGNKGEAQLIARRFLKAAAAERFEILDATKVRKGFPKIGELFKILVRAAQLRELRVRTVMNYMSSLRVVVRKGLGLQQVNVEEQSTEILNRKLVEGYVRSVFEKVDGDEDAMARARRTVRSTLNQARRCFAGWALEAYRDLDLPPTLAAEFMKVEGSKSAPVRYRLPAAELREGTIRAGRLLRGEAPDLYAVFLLCYDLGLRASEAVAAQWSWFRPTLNGWALEIASTGGFKVKGRGSDRVVPVSATVWRYLQEIRQEGREYVLPGANKTARQRLINYEFSAWMRGQGWDRKRYPRAAHELRKLMGSRWFTELGAEVAQAWLGHADIATTCRYYAALTRQPAPLPMDGTEDKAESPALQLAKT